MVSLRAACDRSVAVTAAMPLPVLSVGDGNPVPDGGGEAGQAPPLTRVDGKGLWRSWKRNFAHKLPALLDLIDNALDASLADDAPDFIGRVHVYPDKVETSAASAPEGVTSAPDAVLSVAAGTPDLAVKTEPRDGGRSPEVDLMSSTVNTGLCIVNNSLRPIRPLEQVLEVYNSSKVHSGAGDIGENGVGLKQGCATLSDLSFVLVKNGKEGYVELGIVAESLQRAEGCYLPAFRFDIASEDHAVPSLVDQMSTLFTQPKHLEVAKCVARYGAAVEGGHSDMTKGIGRLLQQFDNILNFFNNDFVFAIVLHEISYGDAAEQRHQTETNPIRDLRAVIPRTYLHVPPSFDFRVVNSRAGRERVVFQYWQQRLVEFSSFVVRVDKLVPWRNLPFSGRIPSNEPLPQGSYRLRVFIGFDRMKANGTERKAASLYIYSRASGRLIRCEQDARSLLCLDAGGTMYSQGLTILIDDRGGQLPLNPTKTDIAFGEKVNGDVHKDNLFTWVRAITKFFYDYHLAKFDKLRTKLTAGLAKIGTGPVQMRIEEIDKSRFTTFATRFKHYRNIHVILEQSMAKESIGPDTHLHLIPPSQPSNTSSVPSDGMEIAVPAAKRARINTLNYQHDLYQGDLITYTAALARARQEEMQQAHSYAGVYSRGVAEARSSYPQAKTQFSPQEFTPPYPHVLPGSHSTQPPSHHQPQYSQPLDQIYTQANNNRATSSPPKSQVNYQQPDQQPLQANGAGKNCHLQQAHNHPGVSYQIATGASANKPHDVAGQQVPTYSGETSNAPIIHGSVEAPKDLTTQQLKKESDTVPNEVINLADTDDEDSVGVPTARIVKNELAQQTEGNTTTESDIDNDDDNSVASTKDYYKDLCHGLSLKLEQRNERDREMKKKCKSLGKEIVQLKKEIERQAILLSKAQESQNCDDYSP